jgi:hypothetical protein
MFRKLVFVAAVLLLLVPLNAAGGAHPHPGPAARPHATYYHPSYYRGYHSRPYYYSSYYGRPYYWGYYGTPYYWPYYRSYYYVPYPTVTTVPYPVYVMPPPYVTSPDTTVPAAPVAPPNTTATPPSS